MSGHNTKEETNPQLVEFRLNKLEEAVEALTAMKDCVLKWDSKFSSNESFLQCPIHKARMEQFEKRVDKLEVIVEDLDRFKWKAVGVLSIVILIVQIFGTAVVENLVRHPAAASVNHTTSKVVPSSPNTATNAVVNVSTNFNSKPKK